MGIRIISPDAPSIPFMRSRHNGDLRARSRVYPRRGGQASFQPTAAPSKLAATSSSTHRVCFSPFGRSSSTIGFPHHPTFGAVHRGDSGVFSREECSHESISSPHVRGGGPGISFSSACAMMFSPQAYGWSRDRACQYALRSGFPDMCGDGLTAESD
jgi:hypothetical protein